MDEVRDPLSKRLSASLALERSLSAVDPLVVLQG